jgi:hypothetical protein
MSFIPIEKREAQEKVDDFFETPAAGFLWPY